VQQTNRKNQIIRTRPIEDLKSREFLTVTQVSKLIGCSRQNVYKLINSGKLKATNILEKKTIVKRTDLDELFNKPTIKESASSFDVKNFYAIKEIESKFGVSRSFVQEVIQRNNIPKRKHGKFALVPKQMIDDVFM
jgi:excisionase family DNA binding protein